MNPGPLSFSLVIPAYNESEGIQSVLEASLKALTDAEIGAYEIVVVNDGSTDDTPKILEEWAAVHHSARIIHHEGNKGLGAANQTGFGAARGEWVGWIPGDGQFLAADLLKIFKEKDPSADVIIANIQPATRTRTDGFIRTLLSRGMRVLLKLLTGTRGNMTGIYLFKKHLFNDKAPLATTGLFNILFPHMLEERGHCVSYEWIKLYPRQTGVSKVANRRTIFKTLSEMTLFRRKYFPR